MSRWKELPAELDPRVRQLVVRLRRLKDHSGLSMRQLAAKTGYSAKSWERYLGGRSMPPREAVEAVARIGGDDPTRLLALHEVAAEAWGDRRGGASAPEAPFKATEAPRATEATTAGHESPSAGTKQTWTWLHGRSLRVVLVAGTVALVLAVSSAVLTVGRLTAGDNGHGNNSDTAAASRASSAAAAVTSPSARPTYTCRVERIDGRWYAGNSRTQKAILVYGQAGPEAAEAQCLLDRAGFTPGDVDGIYGPLTQRAVKHIQKRNGLVVDGIVGPHTWKALRE